MTPFDVVVEGTGLFESIFCCAASKLGKSVLQTDQLPFYGCDQATLSFAQLQSLVSNTAQNEGFIKNVQLHHSSTSNTQNVSREEKDAFLQGILFDLQPRLLRASSQMTLLLRNTKVAAYLSFKPLHAIYFSLEGSETFSQLPLSKECVFANAQLSLREKHSRMIFFKKIKNLAQFDAEVSQEVGSFDAEARNLDREMLAAINMIVFGCQPHEPLKSSDWSSEKRPKLLRFIESCGVFGKTPYLSVIYGASEIIQGFVRLSAVNGAIQMLGSSFEFESRDSSFLGRSLKPQSDMDCVQTSFLIRRIVALKKGTIYSQILLATQPLIPVLDVLSTEYAQIMACKEVAGNFVRIIQSTAACGVCPENAYVIHISSTDPFEDYTNSICSFLEILLNVSFCLDRYASFEILSPKNVEHFTMDNWENGFDETVRAAKDLFLKHFPANPTTETTDVCGNQEPKEFHQQDAPNSRPIENIFATEDD